MTGLMAGAISTGDGQAGFPIPWKSCRIMGFGYACDVGGTASGPTGLMINRVRNESDSEMLSTTLTLAHDAGTVSAETRTTFQNNQLQRGDIVRIDADAVTTNLAGVAWWVELHIDQR
jgi:hypothetical protein